MLNKLLLTLASASLVWAGEDQVAGKVVIAGTPMNTAALPRGLVLRSDLGIITVPQIDGQIIAHARNRKGGLYETRATITPNGDFLLLYPDGGHYGSTGAKVNDMLVWRSADKGKTWTGPKIAFDIDYNQHGFIPLTPHNSRRIYAFGTQPIPGMYTREHGLQENAPIGFRYSDDDGHTWSEVRIIRPINDPDFRGMSVTRMTETDSGVWLLGAHTGDWSFKSVITRQYILRSEDQGKTWKVLPGPRNKGWATDEYGRMEEGRPISLGGGKVLLMTRTGEGHLWALRSNDDGKTWSDPKSTSLVHPNAPPMVFHLADGKTLIAFTHNNPGAKFGADRAEIWFATSTDGGETWSEPRFMFANALGEDFGNPWRDDTCSYLDMIEDRGVIHLFVPHRWERVLYLKLRESDLASLPVKAGLRQ